MADRLLKLLTLAWLLAIGAGFCALLKYSGTPGEAGRALSAWPVDSCLVRDPGRATLVLAVHPRCPCSRATMDALAQVMARSHGAATVHVLFCKPAEFPAGWEKSDLWDCVALIPGVTAVCDEDGQESEKHGAETSGHAVLYSRRGELLFAGGITVARGHQGAGPSFDALISCVTDGTASDRPWPVFGCPLRNPAGNRP